MRLFTLVNILQISKQNQAYIKTINSKMKNFQKNTRSENNLKLKNILQKMPTFYSNHAKSDFSQRDKSFQLNQKPNEQNDLQYYPQEMRDLQKRKKSKTANQTPKVLKQFRIFKRSLKQLDIQKNKQNRRRNYSQKFLDKNLQTKSLGRSKSNKTGDLKLKIQLDKQKHPKKYRILQNLGYTQEQVFRMKSQDLNEKLNSFVKNKGLEYLRQDKQKNQMSIDRTKTQPVEHLKTIKEKIPLKKIVHNKYRQQFQFHQEQPSRKQGKRIKSPSSKNYLPQIHEQLKYRKRQQNKKSLSSSQSVNSFRQKSKNFKLVRNLDNNQLVQKSVTTKLTSDRNQKKQTLALIRRREDILGKIVFDKVKSHLKIKKKPNYFDRVKSQENVDGALIQFLKMKINRAEVTMK